jgi:hypothetical protein
VQITEVRYKMLRTTQRYENDTVEVAVAVHPGEDVGAAIALARITCEQALRAKVRDRAGTLEVGWDDTQGWK